MHGPAVRIVVALAALTLLSPGIAPVVAQAPPKAVLILSEGSILASTTGPVPPTTSVLRSAIVAALRQSAEPVNVYEELIDRGQFDNDDYHRQLLALYKAKYSHDPPDLVIALTEPALDFALRHRGELFPK